MANDLASRWKEEKAKEIEEIVKLYRARIRMDHRHEHERFVDETLQSIVPASGRRVSRRERERALARRYHKRLNPHTWLVGYPRFVLRKGCIDIAVYEVRSISTQRGLLYFVHRDMVRESGGKYERTTGVRVLTAHMVDRYGERRLEGEAGRIDALTSFVGHVIRGMDVYDQQTGDLYMVSPGGFHLGLYGEHDEVEMHVYKTYLSWDLLTPQQIEFCQNARAGTLPDRYRVSKFIDITMSRLTPPTSHTFMADRRAQ